MFDDAPGGAYDWLHFVARSCDEGRRWAEEYRRPESIELTREVQQALDLLRRDRIEVGREMLARAEARTRLLVALSPSLRHVLDRWYYGALAYYHYRRGEIGRAQQLLDQMDDAVRAAIEERRFLLPLAVHCHEFCLQRARIARSLRLWEEMRRQVARSRAMMENRLPLCVLRGGDSLYISTVADFYLSPGGLSPEETAALRDLLDDKRRLDLFERFVAGLYALHGPVIPYLAKARETV